MSASHMSSTEYLLQKTYQILCFFSVFFWNVAIAETEQFREQVKIRSNVFYRSHDTIIIRLSIEIKHHMILKQFFTQKLLYAIAGTLHFLLIVHFVPTG